MKENSKDNDNLISATEFKKYFLQLVDKVKNSNNSFVITKRKIPVAQVTPLSCDTEGDTQNYYGFMKGTTSIKEDLVNSNFETEWQSDEQQDVVNSMNQEQRK